jgi:hypothetical protein
MAATRQRAAVKQRKAEMQRALARAIRVAVEVHENARNTRHNAGGDHTPTHHDPRNPAPGADTQQDQVARYFEQHVRDMEQSNGDAVHPRRETEAGVPSQCRDRNVRAVD